MSARPWFKFYPADWRSDTALRSCSLQARAVWLEMITLMDEADPRGHLVLNGRPMQPKQIAMLAACSEREVVAALNELEEAGVFSRTVADTIISRKMVRETKVSTQQRDRAGARWGSPENAELFGSGIAETDAQSPEARVQKPENQSPEARATRARKPETPIPEGFPDQEALTKGEAMVSGAGVMLDVGRQAVRFRGHAETNDRRCRDWRAAWRTWLEKSIEQAPVLVHSAQAQQMSAAESAAIDLRKHRYWMEDWKKGNPWDRKIRGPRPDEIGCGVPEPIMAEFGHTPVRRAEG